MTKYFKYKNFASVIFLVSTATIAQSTDAQNNVLYFDGSSSGTYSVDTSDLNPSAQLSCSYTGFFPFGFSGLPYSDVAYNFGAKTVSANINSRDELSIRLNRFSGHVQCFGPARSDSTPPENPAQTDPTPTPTDPVPTDPIPTEDPGPAEDPEPEHPADHSNDDVNDGSAGNYPAGSPGSSTFDVGPTSSSTGTSDGTGSFRTRCDYSHALKDDPIVYPGQPGKSHLHIFFGNTKANANSTVDSIKNSGSSTCRGGIANRSSYWVPAVLRLDGSLIVPEFMDVYYKSGYSLPANTIQPFPRGLRMIAGDMNATSLQSHVYWGCRTYIGKKQGIPFGQCPAGDAYQASIIFPQCWDGVNLDSADHKSHMAYASGRSCPSSHPVPIPEITFNVVYPVNAFNGVKLSSDHIDNVPPGSSLHADWFEGWDQDIADTFVRSCVAAAVDCHSHLLGDGREIR